MAEQIKYLDLQGLTYYDSKIKSHIATKDNEIKVTNDGDDLTLLITPGSTNAEGVTTNTKIKVNIDGETIVKNAKGEISVASSTLTQYVGDKKAIEVSDVNESSNEKTISLKIKSGDQILSAATGADEKAEGLTATLKVKALTAAEISALSDGANVKEAYKIVGIGDVAITDSDVIKVYKDSALQGVQLLHAKGITVPTYKDGTWTDIAEADRTEANLALCFAYQLADGSINVQAVPVGDFLRETEFAKGLAWNAVSGKVEGVVDETSESFLTVGEDGFKLSGVQDAIDEAAADAKTTLTEVAADAEIPATGAPKIVVTKTVDENDGHFNYNVSAQDMASAKKLEAEVERAKSAETAIDAVVGLTKGANDETRTYTNDGTFIGQGETNTIKSDIKALDDAIAAFTPITYGGADKDIDKLFA